MCVFKNHAFIFPVRPPRWRCKTIHIRQLLLCLYTTGIIKTLQTCIMYTNIDYNIHGTIPLLLCFPFLHSLLLPIRLPNLLGALLAVTGSVHLVPRLLINWSSLFLPLFIYPPFQNPDPPEFPRFKYTFIRMTSRIWLTRSSTLTSLLKI